MVALAERLGVRRGVEFGVGELERESYESGKGMPEFEFEYYLREYFESSELPSLSFLEREVGSFFAERLAAPTYGRAVLREGGWEDEEGMSYEERMEKAEEYWGKRGREDFVERFEAEKLGMRRARRIVEKEKREKGSLPMFVIGSPPGEIYRNEEGEAASMHWLFMPDGEREEVEYEVYTVPSEELDIKEHIELLEVVGEVRKSRESLDLVKERMREVPESVVALPVLLREVEESLEKLVGFLGYVSFEEMDKQAHVLAERERDQSKDWRISYLKEHFARRLRKEVEKENLKRGQAIVEAMRFVVTREAGGKLIGMGEREIEKEIRKAVLLGKKVAGLSFEQKRVGKVDVYFYADEMRRLLFENTKARRAFVGFGCSGGGIGGVESVMSGMGGGFYNFERRERVGLEEVLRGEGGDYLAGGESESKMKCVECPSCKSTVDAIVKNGQIKCPECGYSVRKS